MQWRVVKMGAEMFDLLHAAGLALLLAQATMEPVELVDHETDYLLTSAVSQVPQASPDLIEQVLVLPAKDQRLPSEHLSGHQGKHAAGNTPDLPVANLDGLLTALFTTPGVRSVSVADVLQKQGRDPSALTQAVEKVAYAVAEWKKYASQVCQRDPRQARSWLERLLRDYDLHAPAIPSPAPVHKDHELSLLMMLDPTLSYSTHREHSDGLVTQGTNLTIHGASCAVLLAQLGAARFLRAQRLPHGMVNCYVPLASTVTISASIALAPLPFQSASPEQARILHWLQYAFEQRQLAHQNLPWKGIAYQTLQTQGTQQSFSCHQGCLDLLWLLRLNPTERGSLLFFWRRLCWVAPDACPETLDTLFDALENRQMVSWVAHLREMARCFQAKEHLLPRCYRWKEVKAMTDLMHPTRSASALFQTILQRKGAGTLRVGRALRLLGRADRSGLLDRIEDLEKVQTLNQLNHTLAMAIQECALLEARTPFIIIPDENDTRLLCADVEQSDPHTIASFLILLSVLEYPGEDGKRAPKEPLLSHTCTF